MGQKAKSVGIHLLSTGWYLEQILQMFFNSNYFVPLGACQSLLTQLGSSNQNPLQRHLLRRKNSSKSDSWTRPSLHCCSSGILVQTSEKSCSIYTDRRSRPWLELCLMSSGAGHQGGYQPWRQRWQRERQVQQDPGSGARSSAQFPHCWTCLFGRVQCYVTAQSHPRADLPAGHVRSTGV